MAKIVKPETTSQEVDVSICDEKNPMDVEQAKSLLGWQDVAEGQGDYIREVKAICGLRGRCVNNVTNRPIYSSVLQTLAQEHLRKRWQLNGEPIIVGRQGHILNGQHSLLSLVIAAKLWADNEEWRENWLHEPTMEKIVVLGISEEDAVVNTMDTCKPRSLADVIYRSEFFAAMDQRDRRAAARATDYAIRILWHRTGAGLDAFAPRRTHSESLDFLARHPKILECVKHIVEEDGKEGTIIPLISTGYAAGLLYLMGSSATDPAAYRSADNPGETHLDWKTWDAACDYWVLLASDTKEVSAVRQAISALLVDGTATKSERWAVFIKGWARHLAKQPVNAQSLALSYKTDEDGARSLDECPVCGGIDLGDPEEADEEHVVDRRAGKVVPPPTSEQIDKRAAVERKKAIKTLQPKRAGDSWSKGDVAWVKAPDGDHYLGRLVEDPIEVDGGSVRVRVEASDGEWDVETNDLSIKQPPALTSSAAPQPKSGSKLATKPHPHPHPQAKGAGKKIANAKDTWAVGLLVWAIATEGGDPWQGRIIELHPQAARVRVGQGHRGSGTIRTVPLGALRREQPRRVAASA